MALDKLSHDLLARVCSHLHRVDHDSLARVCQSLAHSLCPANASLWQDVLRHKYGTSSLQSSPFRTHRAHDDASDSLCFTGAWKTLASSTNCHPIAVSSEKKIYVSDDKSLSLFDHHGNRLRQTNLARKTNAMAVHGNESNMIALGWDRAISVYNEELQTTRPLRGHTSTIRTIRFISDDLLASGADDGTIRIHDPKSRRTRGVLRAHAGSVVQMEIRRKRADNVENYAGDVNMFSRAGERVVQWDVAAQRPVRTYVGGKFMNSIRDNNTLYALSPGDGCSIRIYDARVSGVSAILSLPRKWSNDSTRKQIMEFTIAHNDAIVASVGDGGIAHWPASGNWEGHILSTQRTVRPRRHAPILLRNNSFALTTSTGLPGDECLFVAARLLSDDGDDINDHDECVVKTLWPGWEGGAFTKLENFHDGNKVLATREHQVLLFDSSRSEAEINWDRLGEIDIENDSYGSGKSRFWSENNQVDVWNADGNGHT